MRYPFTVSHVPGVKLIANPRLAGPDVPREGTSGQYCQHSALRRHVAMLCAYKSQSQKFINIAPGEHDRYTKIHKVYIESSDGDILSVASGSLG